MRLKLGVVALLGMCVLGAAYGAAAAAPDRASFTAVYRVTAVTHSSSSRKNDPPYYKGSSTSNWTLAPATASASNLVGVSVQGPIVYGAGRVNVRGVFRAQATSNRPGRCSLTAATGSKKYPAVAPAAFPLTIAADPKASRRVLVIQGPGYNVHATLGNPYFPSECSTTITGEPEARGDVDEVGAEEHVLAEDSRAPLRRQYEPGRHRLPLVDGLHPEAGQVQLGLSGVATG